MPPSQSVSTNMRLVVSCRVHAATYARIRTKAPPLNAQRHKKKVPTSTHRPILEYIDLVCVSNSGQAVGNDQDTAVTGLQTRSAEHRSHACSVTRAFNRAYHTYDM